MGHERRPRSIEKSRTHALCVHSTRTQDLCWQLPLVPVIKGTLPMVWDGNSDLALSGFRCLINHTSHPLFTQCSHVSAVLTQTPRFHGMSFGRMKGWTFSRSLHCMGSRATPRSPVREPDPITLHLLVPLGQVPHT